MAAAAAAALAGMAEQVRAVARVHGRRFYVSPATLALLVCNVTDGLFTLFFLQRALAEELNPLMRWAYEQGPLVFMALKLLIVHAGVVLLCLHRDLGASRVALRVGACVYLGINAYHLAFLGHWLLNVRP